MKAYLSYEEMFLSHIQTEMGYNFINNSIILHVSAKGVFVWRSIVIRNNVANLEPFEQTYWYLLAVYALRAPATIQISVIIFVSWMVRKRSQHI